MLLSKMFKGCPDIEIEQLSIDSRLPMKNCIFFCLSGIRNDGHQFIEEAITNGAKVIVYENEIVTGNKAIYIKVDDVADCLNSCAKKFYDDPTKDLEIYQNCGCDNVNTITYLLRSILNPIRKCAAIGIEGIDFGDFHHLSKVPTLTILDTFKYLSQFRSYNIKALAMESDAMALSYKKLDAVKPDVFIYLSTNPYSSSYQQMGLRYYDALCNYLYTLDDDTAVLLNSDDVAYEELLKACGSNVRSFGSKKEDDYYLSDIRIEAKRTLFTLKTQHGEFRVCTKLLGRKNAYALTAALAALDIRGYDIEALLPSVETIPVLKGHMENLQLGQNYNVIVDVADNWQSIKDCFIYAKKITPSNCRVIALSDLDMSDDASSSEDFLSICKRYVDELIITEKNTYNDTLSSQVSSIEKDLKNIRYIVVQDRSLAIEAGIELLNKGDTFLILGKGAGNFIIRNLGIESYKGDDYYAREAILKRTKEESAID